jgi:hypothetical protein
MEGLNVVRYRKTKSSTKPISWIIFCNGEIVHFLFFCNNVIKPTDRIGYNGKANSDIKKRMALAKLW